MLFVTSVKLGDFKRPNLTSRRRPGTRRGGCSSSEQGGLVHLILNGQRIQGTPFLDVSRLALTSGGGERGLLSIAFALDYSTSGNLYAFYTDTGGDLRIDEFKRSADPNRADPATGRRSVLSARAFLGGQP